MLLAHINVVFVLFGNVTSYKYYIGVLLVPSKMTGLVIHHHHASAFPFKLVSEFFTRVKSRNIEHGSGSTTSNCQN